MAAQNFSDVFHERVAAIEAEAKAAGITVVDLTQRAGVARNCFHRWARGTPTTIEMVDQLTTALAELKAAKAG